MAKFEDSWEKMPLIVELNLVLLYVLKNHEQGAQDDHLDFHTALSFVHLNVLVDSFYTALFSALEQTSCAPFCL